MLCSILRLWIVISKVHLPSDVYHEETVTWLLEMENALRVTDESTLCSVLATISVLSHVQESGAVAGGGVT